MQKIITPLTTDSPTRWLVTGASGFIGMHTCQKLLARGEIVFGIDNLNDYYDVALKKARLSQLEVFPNFHFQEIDIANREAVATYYEKILPNYVIHLAAQAGVRYSILNPQAYLDANLQGFLNILEGCRHNNVKHLVYASSSSVYGGNKNLPFSEKHNVDHPISLYAATKKANELMAHTYSHLYKIPTTGLRFFTVYGPWGRPDMALFLFTKAILSGQCIDVFNHGNMIRDFTYISDIVEGVVRVADKPATPNYDVDTPSCSDAPYRIFNIGNNQPTPLLDYINALELALGKTAVKNFLPMQAGDVPVTFANTDELSDWVGFKPNTSVDHGVAQFVNWYRSYYKV